MPRRWRDGGPDRPNLATDFELARLSNKMHERPELGQGFEKSWFQGAIRPADSPGLRRAGRLPNLGV